MTDELTALVDASPNFSFLAGHDPALAADAALAEYYFHSDLHGSLFKSRHFGEMLARTLLRRAGLRESRRDNQPALLGRLLEAEVIPASLPPIFTTVQQNGNDAAHDHAKDPVKALDSLRGCHQLGAWWHERETGQPLGRAFVLPPPPNVLTRELTARLEEQLVRLTEAYEQGLSRPAPRLVIRAGRPDPHDWRGGTEVHLGDSSYLVHDPVDTVTAPNGSWRLMQADGHRLDQRSTRVRLRGLLVRDPTGPGGRLVEGLGAQAEFLGRRPVRDGPLHVLVIPRPPGSSWTEMFGAGDRPLDPYAVPPAIDALIGVAGELTRLHRRRQAHRALDGDVILVPRQGRPAALRDPGRAWWPGLPGEGEVRYPAPEQRALAAGRPGPATDVYQLAALLQHTCAGHPPTAGAAIRLRVFLPGLPDQVDDLLRRALDPDPANRPAMSQLAAGLRQARGSVLGGTGA
ncbi:hypothetical protein ODJ79_45775 [Actinoplanes sp. KI2]|uniref:hypothetical protein n=1 Tax=Actinoplanes sp. KI2 TaxID=2983315 RepID=UPI0021D5B778|nr:hypothetical protein [Actinoplanes sp. KI2]MCU7731068.1 hypothetical protein [Actinoplanes sp. KI2]